MMQAIDRANKIVTNMLDFSRQRGSHFDLLDINDLIERILELASHDYDLKKKYDFKKIKILRNFSSELPQIRCIKTEIEQVFLNIIKNAAYALFNNNEISADPMITISTYLRDEDIIIEIEDNGPGIPEIIKSRIFEPFFTTKDTKGTGLGLSVSYFIISTNHKGKLYLDERKSDGAKFVIELPVNNYIEEQNETEDTTNLR